MSCHLIALSPLDGRYKGKVLELEPFFSEYALIFYRLYVEIEWLQKLSSLKDIPEMRKLKKREVQFLENIWQDFSETISQ